MTGYFAISLPDDSVWQGFFLPDEYMDKGKEVLEKTRELSKWIDSQGKDNTTPIRPLGNLTYNDEVLLGSLCATLIELAGYHNMEGIARIAAAISILIDHPFFIVEGEVSPSGTETKIDLIDANSIEEARKKIQAKFS